MGLELEVFRFLSDLAIILLVALVLGYMANRMGQPALLGYLFAGIIVGPHSWNMLGVIFGDHVVLSGGLITNTNEIDALALVGVSLLLFIVGLEFSPKKLKKIWRPSSLSGTFEMFIMFLLGTIAGLMLGWTLIEAFFLGTMLMMSSTIIIIKILHETDQMDTLHGRLLVGKLIVQDIAAIVVITTLTSITSTDTSLMRFLPLFLGILFMVLMVVLGRKVFPKLIESVSRAPSKELFLLTIFGICITIAVVSEPLDLSLALGAFMAGIILSESDLHLDIM